MPPPYNEQLEPGDGSGYGGTAPYFYLNISNYSENLYWNANQEKPLPNNFSLNLKSYLVSNRGVTFDIYFSEPVSPWITLIGSSVDGKTITVGSGGLKNLAIQLSNLDQMPNGEYHAEIIFQATGSYDNQISTYDFASYFITLTISNNDSASIMVEKNQYNVFFNRSTNTLNGDTVVNVLNNSTPTPLKFIADNFLTKTDIIDTFNIENAGIENNSNLPSVGNVNVNGGLFKADNSRIANVNINLAIGLNSDIFADKSILNFSINKSQPQTATDSIYITNPENKPFQITVPSFLTFQALNGLNTSGFVKLTTVSSADIVGGVYTGNIIITYETKQIVIPVLLTVVSFSSFQVASKFCLDIPQISFNKMNVSARLVRITVTAVFNLNGVETIKENVYAQPYVNGKAMFNLSDKIQSQFPRFKGDYFTRPNNFVLMKNAVVNLKLEELDISYNTLLTETITGLNLFPGSEPIGFPLLSNFLFRKKNKRSIFFNSKVVDDKIVIEKIENHKNLDEIVYSSKKVKYYQYPENYHSIDIHFENENLVPEWFTFNGEYKITAEFSHTYAKNIFKTQNEKYDFTKVKTLSINTGFFMRKELNLIEKMVESKIAFMRISDKIYRCFCTTQKLILDDSSEELLSRELEFLIVEE